MVACPYCKKPLDEARAVLNFWRKPTVSCGRADCSGNTPRNMSREQRRALRQEMMRNMAGDATVTEDERRAALANVGWGNPETNPSWGIGHRCKLRPKN